jgi:AraC-like DNA-binding protein
MDPNAHFSALSSWVLCIAKAIDSYGLDSREVFAEVGLDHSRLHDPVARFSYPAVGRLWELATRVTGDAGFGLTVANYWHPTTLHALGYAWLASSNLEEAFERAVRYSRIVNTAAGGILRVERNADTYRVIVGGEGLSQPPAQVSLEAALAMLMVMCRAAYGVEFRPIRVTIRRQKPDCADRFIEMFSAPVIFSEQENAIWIDLAVVSQPLITANPELVRINDQIVTDYLAQLDRSDIIMQVRSRLVERLPSGATGEAEVAASINLSRRSLQRRLSEQGISFKQLLQQTRRELSLQYVRGSQHSFNEIAYLLGFAEPANFSRAFKRWYGQSPTEFRRSGLA